MQRRVVVKVSVSGGITLGWIEGPVLFSSSMVLEMMEAGYILSFCTGDPVALIASQPSYPAQRGYFLACFCLFKVEKLLSSWGKREFWK